MYNGGGGGEGGGRGAAPSSLPNSRCSYWTFSSAAPRTPLGNLKAPDPVPGSRVLPRLPPAAPPSAPPVRHPPHRCSRTLALQRCSPCRGVHAVLTMFSAQQHQALTRPPGLGAAGAPCRPPHMNLAGAVACTVQHETAVATAWSVRCRSTEHNQRGTWRHGVQDGVFRKVEQLGGIEGGLRTGGAPPPSPRLLTLPQSSCVPESLLVRACSQPRQIAHDRQLHTAHVGPRLV